MAITVTSYGSAQNKTAATTVVFSTTSVIPPNTLLVLAVCSDNVAAATPIISSITAIGGGTWTNQAGSVSQSGATATAGAGVFVYCQTLFTSSQVASGTSITVTFNASPTAKALKMWGFSDMTNQLRNTVASAASTTGVPSIATAGTALVAGDLVIGIAGAENNAAMTGDTDTLNGSWSAIDGLNTTGGQAATNVSINMQYKIVTATGAQTYNPTGGAADSVAIVFAMVPMMAIDLSDTVGISESPLEFLANWNKTYSDTLPVTDSRTPVLTLGGWPKAWIAGTYYEKPGKVWMGSGWVIKPWKRWTGSQWLEVS